jgi:hypothetical protein
LFAGENSVLTLLLLQKQQHSSTHSILWQGVTFKQPGTGAGRYWRDFQWPISLVYSGRRNPRS